MALVAPIFALLLLVFALWARLAITQLALVQLTRDATLMIARNGHLWNQPLRAQEAAVKRLALRQTLLDPTALTLSYDAVAPVGLGQVAALQEALNSPIGAQVKAWSGMRRYRLSYPFPLAGAAKRLLPRGLTLQESLVVHGDPWKMEASSLMQEVMR